MALLLETTLGDLVIDLDVQGSPKLCRNILKLAKARYYTNCLVNNVQPNRFCQTGDPSGDGNGGACIFGLIDSNNNESSGADIKQNPKRFLKSQGRILSNAECQERGRVVATELNGIPDTIGSQFLITLREGPDRALDGYRMTTATTSGTTDDTSDRPPHYYSLGSVTEDDKNVLDQIHDSYCDAQGRPYADIRIIRALVLHDPFDDPPGMDDLLHSRGVLVAKNGDVTASPSFERPKEEHVEVRIPADQVEPDEDDEQASREQDERIRKKEDKSRAVVLEMLGDLPSAEIKAPENVLFICKLNSVTDDEDLELIFSRFDPDVKVEIIRDGETGASLQYAFAEFTTKDQCVEAYFKMNNVLIDDRRVKVDFSQSVAKIWNRYAQRMRGDSSAGQGRYSSGRGGRGGGRGRGHTGSRGPGRDYSRQPPGRRDDVHSRRALPHRNGKPGFHKEDDRFGEARRHAHSLSPRREGGRRDDRYNDNRYSRQRDPEREEARRHDSRERKRNSRSPSSDSRDWKRRRQDHHSTRRHKHERRRRVDEERRGRHEEDSGDVRKPRSDDKADRRDDERKKRRRHEHEGKGHRRHKHRRDRDEHGDDERRERKHRKRHRRSRSRSPSDSKSQN